jgi:3-oxoacyl-[acyl-carrier protein] reductase
MDLKLTGKVALVTGSSRGIGLATATAFAAEGCRLMFSARSAEHLRDTEAVLAGSGAEVAAYAADVGEPDEAAGLVQAAVAAYGGIDILVNNVGGGGGGTRIADSTDDDWRNALERNLVQTVRMMRLALPHMQGRPGAAVINVASISGWAPQLAMSGQYGAAKAALIFDTERWPLEFVPHGIRVNTVSPGSILVDGNGWDRYRLANRDYYEDYVRHGFPMGRLGTAEGGRRYRFHGVATRPLDQRPKHSGRRAEATSRAAGSPAVLAGARFVGGSEPPDAANDQRDRRAKQQHERTENEEALTDAPTVGDCPHERRDQDRGQPLTGLTQTDHRALLMAPYRTRLHRQDNRLDHPFEPAARNLKQQQEHKDPAQ